MPLSTASSKLPPLRKTSAARSLAFLPHSQVVRNTGPDDEAAALGKSAAATAAVPATVFMNSRRSTGSIVSAPQARNSRTCNGLAGCNVAPQFPDAFQKGLVGIAHDGKIPGHPALQGLAWMIT